MKSNKPSRSNKYTLELEKKILELSKLKYSSRSIASVLDISKSGVNYVINRYKQPPKPNENGPKLLFIDVETSAALVYCFGRKKQFITQSAIKKEGGKLIVAGYRWLGEDYSSMLYNKSELRQDEDYLVCSMLWNLFNEADAVCGHYIKGFDFKVLQTRCLANGLPPLPSVKIIDTWEMAKKHFKFPDNKLDTVAAYLGLGRKLSNSGISLWKDVQEGDEQALESMLEYCEQDVDLLHDVFLALRSRGLVSTFNAGLYFDDTKHRCVSCGCDTLEYTGRKVSTPAGVYNELRCTECETVQRDKFNQTTKEKRSTLLTKPAAN